MLGENNEESRVFNDEVYQCEECGEEINVSVDNSFGGMDIEIEGVARNDISFRNYPRPIKDDVD